MRNIQEAISPLLVLLSLCGFEVFEYPRGRPRLRLTILYVLVLWSFYIYVVIRTRLYFKEHGMNLLMITKTNIIFSITITLLNLYHNKVWSSQRLLESSDVFLTSIRHHHMFSVTLDGQSMYSFCDAFFPETQKLSEKIESREWHAGKARNPWELCDTTRADSMADQWMDRLGTFPQRDRQSVVLQ